MARYSMAERKSWRDGKTTAQRGYGSRWQKARKGYLAKHPLCVMCARQGRTTAATVVDHVIPHRGDMLLFWQSDNWQPLCASCHDGDKARQERGRPVIGCDADGWPYGRADW